MALSTREPPRTMPSAVEGSCHVCGAPMLREVGSVAALPRVSSDCKPVPAGGRLCQCAGCGALQRPVTPQFLKEIADIYAGYDVYYQSGGLEQLVWDAATSTTLRRSELLCRRLAETGLLPGSGRVLDVGCGNGAFLAALAREGRGLGAIRA